LVFSFFSVQPSKNKKPKRRIAPHSKVLKENKAQDKVGYAVFGKVLSGMDVVDKVRRVETVDRGDHEAVPVDDVVIKSIRRVEKADAKQ